jgi:ABC-type polysaccharide/polyol phosphate export permease
MSIEPQNQSILTSESIFFDRKTTIITGKEQKKLALLDIKEGLAKTRIWTMLAYQDIKLRYRRSILGPFWITLSMAMTVYSMGLLYSHLFHIELQVYFPFLVTGMLSWTLISTLICELLETFTQSEGLIKQIKLPYSLYIHRVISRHFIIFLHNFLVYVPIIAIFHEAAKINLYSLLLVPCLFIIYFNAFTYGLILAILGARYRDLVQIIKSLIQIAFFITPVMWNPAVLPEKYQHLILLNPFYAFVELIREPLLGHCPTTAVFLMAAIITIIGTALCSALFVKYRSRIVYWL